MLSGRGGEGRERKIGRNLYGRKLVKIPVPQFVVFYNGEEEAAGGTGVKAIRCI